MTRYFLILATLVASCRPASPRTPDQASIALPGCSAALVFERTPAHAYLAEYTRTLSLRRAGGEVMRIQLEMDTGGIAPLALYELAPGHFLVKDPLYSYAVTCEQISVASGAAIMTGAVLLGHFEGTAGSSLAFNPASPSEPRGN